MSTSSRKRVAKERRREDIMELKPSEYLRKYFNIVLPPKIAEFWDRAAYVEEDGKIDFPDVVFDTDVEGYWERVEGKPFFDDELRKALSWYLFDKDPKYSIIVCPAGSVCEISEDSGYFEFMVFDTEKDKLVFSGAVMGTAAWEKEADGKTYTRFLPRYIVLEPRSA